MRTHRVKAFAASLFLLGTAATTTMTVHAEPLPAVRLLLPTQN
ncbi:hypothetical protein [Polycyclovorans algicola]|nr:hypothetical protein [Polycyclovorans algicola]